MQEPRGEVAEKIPLRREKELTNINGSKQTDDEMPMEKRAAWNRRSWLSGLDSRVSQDGEKPCKKWIRRGPKEVLITKYMQNQGRTIRSETGRGSFRNLDHTIFDGAG